jgi:predicted ATPase with chaperone activity
MSAIPAMPESVSQPGRVRGEAPPIPERLADTGLTADFVRDLLLKTLYVQGTRTGQQLAEFVCLPFAMVDEELLTLQQRRFIEVRGTTGPNRGNYVFDLAGDGRQRAKDAIEASQYVGPAPVPLRQYQEQMAAQSIRHAHVTQPVLRDGLSHLVLGEELFDILGPAVNSSKSIFLYGHPGNGKTAIAEAVSQMLGGAVYVPYAVEIDGQIMTVFDPVHHELVPGSDAGDASDGIWLRTGPGHDRRFAYVRRPIVVTGGELTLDQLDLQYDPFTKLYQAPFQVKANGGVLIVDDFGRQRVPPRDLLNRWIVPLEKRQDYLTMHTGGKFPIPFDCLLVFATNLDPKELVEEAFLRRIHYKISIEDPTPAGYEEIFRKCCEAEGVVFEPAALAQVRRDFYQGRGIPARACHPRDILAHVADIAKYHDTTPRLTPELVDLACRSYFLTSVVDH